MSLFSLTPMSSRSLACETVLGTLRLRTMCHSFFALSAISARRASACSRLDGLGAFEAGKEDACASAAGSSATTAAAQLSTCMSSLLAAALNDFDVASLLRLAIPTGNRFLRALLFVGDGLCSNQADRSLHSQNKVRNQAGNAQPVWRARHGGLTQSRAEHRALCFQSWSLASGPLWPASDA